MIRNIIIGIILGGAALAVPARAADLRGPHVATCETAPAQRIEMRRIAVQTESDPAKIWTNYEIWNPNTPQKTDIWMGSATLCDGRQIIVSQIINRQCSSASVCPSRVLLKDGNETSRVLINYKQMCTLHGTFALEWHSDRLVACDQPYALGVR